MVINEMRNQMIIDDVVKSHESGRNCLVLTERTNHLELIAGKLRERIPEVMTLRGGRGTREIAEIFKRISDTPADKQLTQVATGRYIGEGFDEPRLDTLFLTMPISWKGTLQQYAGRLHRLFEEKNQKFALIDQKVVWYGSINLLSFGNAEESIMRLESPNIASELLKSMENKDNNYEKRGTY